MKKLHPTIARIDKAVARLIKAHEDVASWPYGTTPLPQRRDEVRRATDAYHRARNYASDFTCAQLGGYWT